MDEPRTHDGKKVVIWLGVVVVIGTAVLILLLFLVQDESAERVTMPAPAPPAGTAGIDATGEVTR